jgi:hypothetical protein
MLIVLIALAVLLGVAMVLLTASRGDVPSATSERERVIAFYAAEAGIAHGKALMSSVHGGSAELGSLVGRRLSRSLDYTVGNVVVPSRYTVTFASHGDRSPDGGTGPSGMLVIRSVGSGPNGASSVVETASRARSPAPLSPPARSPSPSAPERAEILDEYWIER